MTFTVPTAPLFPSLRGRQRPSRHILSATQQEVAYSGEGNGYPQWSIPLYRFEVPFSYVTSGDQNSDWATLEGFIKKVKFSPTTLFQYNFFDDHTAAAQAIGIGDGATLTFQLLRTLGGFAEPVYCPSAITDVKVDGVTADPSTYDVSNRGLVTFHTGHAPAATKAITWDGTFNWYCRFDSDDDQLDNFAKYFWSIQKLTFKTVKMRAA